MNIKELNYYFNKFKSVEERFFNLMKKRVQKILLVSTFYDAFIFEQDGRLTEQIFGEYYQLNLTTIPKITNVPTGEEALKKIRKHDFDLVISTMRIGDISPFELSKKVKEKNSNIPFLLLLTVQSDIRILEKNKDISQYIDNVFLWNGDSKLFLTMVKFIEDQWNLEDDTKEGFVRVILLVEDSIKFYSIYLPQLYTEIFLQSKRLIEEELNDRRKFYRMRVRPKVLLAKNYEEALEICEKYKEYLLCVISDVRYEKNGVLDELAGVSLIDKLYREKWDVAILLQSSCKNHKKYADKYNAQFIHKFSPTLLKELHNFIVDYLGFGDFIFRDEKGNEIDRVSTIAEFGEKLKEIPAESLLYHSRKNHFSSWLLARGEIEFAKRIRPLKNSDFPNTESHRDFLIKVFKELRDMQSKGRIISFDPSEVQDYNKVMRLAEGSLGGKGRSIAFVNALLSTLDLEKKLDGLNIRIPPTLIIGTVEFDTFIENNKLSNIIEIDDDIEIKKRFVSGQLSKELINKLTKYLQRVKKPLAVRSSGLLEDSQSQPFAGIYSTYMLPNNHPDLKVRLKHLTDAIKLVYSSVFLKEAKSYIEFLNYQIEEEKMAVIIQEIVGQQYDNYFYPHISGVAQSYNYYPISYMKHSDGVAAIALGLGQSVVEGERTYRFCPKYPNISYWTQEDLVKYSQTKFYAIDLNKDIDLLKGEHATLEQLDIEVAEKHKSLFHLASVWDHVNKRIIDGLSARGPKVLNFSNILKYNYVPLSELLVEILDISEKAFGVPIEIEFAVDLTKDKMKNILPTFYFLQARPLTVLSEEVSISQEEIENKKDLIVFTKEGMGHGILDYIKNIVVVDPKNFDNTKTMKIKEEVSYFNKKLKDMEEEYILIGPGRWGTRDKFLGVPVQWSDINYAKIIIETALENFNIEPSQGTHFFHNLVAMDVGYFNISFNSDDYIDWDWILNNSAIAEKKEYVFHIRTYFPMLVKMDGKKGFSIIKKPAKI